MPAAKYLTIEFLRLCFREENGRLFWLDRPVEHFPDERAWKIWNTRWAGKEAGSKSHDRWQVCIDWCVTRRYRIVWMLHHGEWPPRLDHENRNPLDDRIENLRIASHSQNAANTLSPCTNRSGYKGVSWHASGRKWRAKIEICGRNKHLGYFDDPALAHAAYVAAAKGAFGEFACG